MASLNLAQLLTILFTVMAASEVSAAPIRRFDVAKRSSNPRLVRRDSPEAQSPLANLLKGIRNEHASDEDSSNVTVVESTPMASASASGSAAVASGSAPASASASSTTEEASPRIAALQEPTTPSSSSSASSNEVDVNAMQSAYLAAIGALPEADHKGKRTVTKRNDIEELSKILEAQRNGEPIAPASGVISVNGIEIDLSNFPTDVFVPASALPTVTYDRNALNVQTDMPAPSAASASASASASDAQLSAAVSGVSAAYASRSAAVSASAASAPASLLSASGVSAQAMPSNSAVSQAGNSASASAAAMPSNSAVSSADASSSSSSSDEADDEVVMTSMQAKWAPIHHGI